MKNDKWMKPFRLLVAGIVGVVGYSLLAGCEPSGNSSFGSSNGDAGKAIKELPTVGIELPDPSEYAAVFYVAPVGDDANPGTVDAPFATLEAARDAVRALPDESWTADVLVAVAPGDYVLERPFVLEGGDSGKNGFKARYRGLGEPGSARLLGARRVTDWQPSGEDGIFVADVGSDAAFSTLYEDGRRARKARYPNYAFDARFPLSGARYLNAVDGTATELTWREGDFEDADLENIDPEANLVYWPWAYAAWHKVTHRIGEMDFETRTITVPDNAKGTAIGKNARYYVEGDRRLLDQPGEFYLDDSEGLLYYWPRTGDPEESEILVPHLKRIVSLEGTAGDPVSDIVIEGFEMSATDTLRRPRDPASALHGGCRDTKQPPEPLGVERHLSRAE